MEQVVLVDEENNPIGAADKSAVHTENTPLHRGFSLFLFNLRKQVLITQRAWSKKTFPGVWTNAVCGHPMQNESAVDAAKRRLRDELGISIRDVKNMREVAPYRYRFADANGIVENEICPILVGFFEGDPKVDPTEVAGWQWISWGQFLRNINEDSPVYSPWSIEEAKIIAEKILPLTDPARQ